MKLSEILAAHPEMDVDFGDRDSAVYLDGVYLMRVIDANDKPGEAWVYFEKTEHTDLIVQNGLLAAAVQIMDKRWPVHICDEEHE